MTTFDSNDIDSLNLRFEESDPREVLEWLWEVAGEKAVLGTGFGPSGIVLIDMLSKADIDIPVFYLDTNLFFPETYELRDELENRFDRKFVNVSTPVSVNEQGRKFGDKLWESNPNKCCYIRKVLPLQRYLSDKKIWITGVRRSQSITRENARLFEWDSHNKVVKVNPLVDWSTEEVWSYVTIYELPYNPLHDNGYPSIGCMPCTSPVNSDDERSGRWAGHGKVECGIHLPTQNND